MTEVALAVPYAEEQRLCADAARHGHRVVARCSGAEELLAQLAGFRPELVVVAADPQYLTARLVETCDERGCRLLVVVGSAHERRYAATVGIVDPVDAPFEWAILGAGGAPGAASSAAATARPALLIQPPSFATPTGASGELDEVDEDTRVRPPRRASAMPNAEARPAAAAAVAVASPLVPQPSARGTVIAVWGPEGAPGRTSLAIALAAELAELGGERDPRSHVVLADADTRAASVAPALGLLDEAPGFAAACRLVGAGGLDGIQFDRIAQAHRTGRADLRVLTGIGRASRWPELTADRIAGVLSAVRDWASVTVVDVAASFEHDEEVMTDLHAPRRNAATLEVIGSADRVVAVGSADPVGLARFLRGHAELVELVGPERVITVINKLRPGAIGAGPAAQVRQTLARFGGIDNPVLVPWDPAAFDAALLSGRALHEVAPRSGARAAIRELAVQLSPAHGAVAGAKAESGRRVARVRRGLTRGSTRTA